MVQEAKQVERQQHLEEQHRLHISAGGLNQVNSTANGTATVNGTDHVDDFLARIDKLRQVGFHHHDSWNRSPLLCSRSQYRLRHFVGTSQPAAAILE